MELSDSEEEVIRAARREKAKEKVRIRDEVITGIVRYSQEDLVHIAALLIAELNRREEEE